MRSRRVTALLALLLALLLAPTGPAAGDGGASSRATSAQPSTTTVPLTAPAPGRLESPPTRRPYGLPVVLAALLVAGVASLLVRVLLNEPAARRRTPARPGRRAAATGGGPDGARDLHW